MALRAESHGKPFTDFLTDCVGMNAVDLNIILVSEIWHDNFQTAIQRSGNGSRSIRLLLGIILSTTIVSSRSEATTYICGRLITFTYPASGSQRTRTPLGTNADRHTWYERPGVAIPP